MLNEFDSIRFCTTLKVWRKMHGFSVTEVLELTSIARSTYNFIEAGDRAPSIAEFSRLCQLMDFDACEFFKSPERVQK